MFESNGKIHHVSSLPLVIPLHRMQNPALLNFFPSRRINNPIWQWLNVFFLPFPHSNFPQFPLVSSKQVKETLRRAMDALPAHSPSSHHVPLGFPQQPQVSAEATTILHQAAHLHCSTTPHCLSPPKTGSMSCEGAMWGAWWYLERRGPCLNL